ncbi:alpha/beta hydrolase [Streptomyces sp. NPDC006134]|uniref:alpha/beta fold hydrolase n=1 Tax=Streptomyces sp. NPDC006134 TaxID=3154467 RepID=UPI0033F3DAB8
MTTDRALSRRGVLTTAAGAAAALTTAAAPAAADTGPRGGPTVVLVHGAFADASSWTPVIGRLQRHGLNVVAPANPLRGLAADAAQLTAVLATLPGPVVLAGHSYGGAVITEAATASPHVKALVHIAAFMPDRGEVLGELAARFPGSRLLDALTQVPVPGPDGAPGADLYLRTDRFHEVFAHDVPRSTARILASVQRPLSAGAFTDRANTAAWRHLPSWVLVAGEDRGIPPELQRFQARRAGARTVEVRSSHLPLYSHPGTVASVIRAAAAQAA